MESGAIKSVPSGRGSLNHCLLMDHIRERKPFINVLMEDTDPATVDEGARFLRGFFPRETRVGEAGS